MKVLLSMLKYYVLIILIFYLVAVFITWEPSIYNWSIHQVYDRECDCMGHDFLFTRIWMLIMLVPAAVLGAEKQEQLEKRIKKQ